MPSVIDVAPELSVRGSLADLVALVKPRIMVMALLTAAGGLSLAPGAPSFELWLTLMVGTALLVGAANTLNMYLERDVDCLMARTRNRPLPRRRLAPQAALTFGVVQAVLSRRFASGAEAFPLRGTGGGGRLGFEWRRLRLLGDPGCCCFERHW